MKLLLHWYIYVYRSWDKWWRSWWICCTHHERSALTNIFPPPSHPSCTIIGAHPISKLDVMDSTLQTDISVYAYPRYRFNDMNTSATPAVAFTAVIHNSLSETVSTSILFNLPLGMEAHTQRFAEQMSPSLTYYQNPSVNQFTAPTALECFEFCSGNVSCLSWTYDISNHTCFMFDDVRMNGHHDGFTAGIKVLYFLCTLLSCDSPCTPSTPSTPILPPFTLPPSLPPLCGSV